MFLKTKIDAKWFVWILLLGSVLPRGGLHAAGEETRPAAIAGPVTLDAEQLIALVARRPETVLIDARLKEDRADGYIEGSVNLVDTKTDCDSLARLLRSRTTPVVFYCNGVRCDRSEHAVRIALACGYRKVYWFRGGIEEWRGKDYPLIQEVTQ
jgi:rhodanese-related sulfurtransferase